MIVLRGDLAAILTFASGKKNPAFLEEKALLEELLGCEQDGKNAKKPLHGKGLSQSQGSLVAGACFHLYLRSSQRPHTLLKFLPTCDRSGLFHTAA
ncbi:hypothetical protein ACLBWS_12250 [Brucellaceae bacterium D45D]